MNIGDLHLSVHAVQRYIDRVRPALDFDQATCELGVLIAVHGRIGPEPVWAEPHALRNIRGWLLVGDDVAFPVTHDRVLTTCIVPGGLRPETRRRRRARKAKRRDIERHRGDTYGGRKSRDRRRARDVGPTIDEEARRAR